MPLSLPRSSTVCLSVSSTVRIRQYVGLFLFLAVGIPAIAVPAQASIFHSFLDNLTPSESSEDLDYGDSYALRDMWKRIFDTEPPEDPQQGGSRGSYFCLAEPGSHDGLVWSDRPTLAWQGPALEVGLYDADNPLNPLWSQSISDADQLTWINGLEANGKDEPIYRVTYDGEETLPPSEAYIWKVQQPSTDVPIYITLMPTADHQQIATELDTLELALRNEGADEDVIALRKADFFASQDLWNDFWYHIGLIQTPANELADVMEAAIGTWCP